MRRANPQWNPTIKNTSNFTNALGVYLEIRQIGKTYDVYLWDGRQIGTFLDSKSAEICARGFRSPLMPTQSIQDIRFVPDPKLAPAKPKKHEKVIMTPITIIEPEFTPIQEDEVVVVEHPEDIITF